jgi:hypothetical protein
MGVRPSIESARGRLERTRGCGGAAQRVARKSWKSFWRENCSGRSGWNPSPERGAFSVVFRSSGFIGLKPYQYQVYFDPG